MEPTLDDDLLRDYLAESNEHLATIETDMLAMEQAGEAIDEERVNRVFRAAHSIKGGAGFFDLATIRQLAHKTENVLDLIRSRQMVPGSDVVSILLLAFDKLRDLLAHHRDSNAANIADYVESLTRLATDHLPAEQRSMVKELVELGQAGSGRRIQVSAFDLSQARAGAKSIYLIEYDLIHDVQRRGETPLSVMRSLVQCGTILETVFDFDSAGTLEGNPSNQLLLEVLYATVLEPDLIGQVVQVPRERVWLVDKTGGMTPLAGPNPAQAPVAAALSPVPPPVAAGPEAPRAVEAASGVEGTIRLNVSLLDSLMTLAGELVLSRNQLNEALSRGNDRGIRSGAQRVSLVTSELQEVVSQTRMQQVGSLFAKFPRLVRDLGRDLGKDVQLRATGSDVEIDKTILEGLSDPLTHMVRNAVDHGIESPAARASAGKPGAGTVSLSAFHEAGQVVIEVSDDGQGLPLDKVASSAVAKGLITREQLRGMTEREIAGLIFMPGVSSAERVSDVSGRGVGMDVVRTNLERLGGKIDIESAPGKGSRFRIKLPLTLAIIPSLLVSDGGERFAIPQVSVGELIRVPAAQIAERIDCVGDAPVLIVRDRLLPLVYLSGALGDGRPRDVSRALNIVLVNTGAFEYGLAVEELHDTVEIVVKPLGRHLKGIPEYAGATILGDGRVSVILDVAGLAARAGLSAAAVAAMKRKPEELDADAKGEAQSLLLFHNGPAETCAVPIEQVARVERIRPSQVEMLGGRRTMQYRGASLPLVTLRDAASAAELSEDQSWVVIVFERTGRPVGLLAAEPLDLVETALEVDSVTLRQRGIGGSAVVKGRTLLLLDIFELADIGRPEPASPDRRVREPEVSSAAPTVLVAEDSQFFRSQLQRLIEAVGYRVMTAADGEAAWELLDRHAAEIGMVATDVEMPRLDGLALTRRIRADQRFTSLPVVALSSLAGEEEIARGLAAGVTEYQVKLDRDQFLTSVQAALGTKTGTRSNCS
jgi:two-component system, chemotaxis family, sensor kinase CheA